jgi:predicted PP-loop superfamily ATPase
MLGEIVFARDRSHLIDRDLVVVILGDLASFGEFEVDGHDEILLLMLCAAC